MSRPVRRGDIFWVPDTSVDLPPTPITQRNLHHGRPFLIFTSDVLCADDSYPIVTGFPLSTAEPKFTVGPDFMLARGTANLEKDSWVQVAMLQPKAKSKLRKFVGHLDANDMEAVTVRFLRYAGVLN